MEKVKRETVSLKLDPVLWKQVKHQCIDEDIDYSTFVELSLKERLKKK